jgi:RNA polymerase sigma factor (sigma-70 family)
MTATDTHRAIEAVFRIEQAKLIAGLARIVRDVGVAEELAQDALVAALEQWPVSGIPDKPGAWLMATAKHRTIDLFRRNKLLERKHVELGYELEVEQETTQPDLDAALDDQVGDDLLRLMYISCHPILSPEGRTALTLRLLGGLTTEEIARAFLVPEPTVQQRIVRAKRTLAEKRVPFEVPRGDELTARLSSVLSVIYLIFNEGYSATAGEDWMRPQLCEEALRLGRILAELAQEEPEVHGLVALMEIQASRFGARTGPSGEPVLLLDQNRARWDQLLIRRGLAALQRAEVQAGAIGRPLGSYALQAAIAACHARAHTAQETNWARIVALYEALSRLAPSPVVDLNHAVAVAFAVGPAAGLELVDALTSDPSLKNYYLLSAVRGDFLKKLGRHEEARVEFEQAAALTRNSRERALLLDRAATCTTGAIRP